MDQRLLRDLQKDLLLSANQMDCNAENFSEALHRCFGAQDVVSFLLGRISRKDLFALLQTPWVDSAERAKDSCKRCGEFRIKYQNGEVVSIVGEGCDWNKAEVIAIASLFETAPGISRVEILHQDPEYREWREW